MTERFKKNKDWEKTELLKKEQEELKDCTFTPQINSSSRLANRSHLEKSYLDKSNERFQKHKVRPASQNKMSTGYRKYNHEIKK